MFHKFCQLEIVETLFHRMENMSKCFQTKCYIFIELFGQLYILYSKLKTENKITFLKKLTTILSVKCWYKLKKI